jgi:hypothetical protein
MIEPVEQAGDMGVQELHGLVLVFLPANEWEEMGENALYSRIDPYYPHGSQMGPLAGEDPRPLPPHTSIGKVDSIFPGGVFRNVFQGEAPSLPSRGFDLFSPASAWRELPPGATCFAFITAEGQWIECYEAEASVLLREEGGTLHPVNPERRLTRLQVRWRHYVAEFARQHPDQVILPCDALLRLSNTLDLARGLGGRDVDAMGS